MINPRTTQKIAKIVIWAAAILVMVILFAIIMYILMKGLPVINLEFLSEIPRNMGRSGGISSTIVGTLIMTAVAVIIEVFTFSSSNLKSLELQSVGLALTIVCATDINLDLPGTDSPTDNIDNSNNSEVPNNTDTTNQENK